MTHYELEHTWKRSASNKAKQVTMGLELALVTQTFEWFAAMQNRLIRCYDTPDSLQA